MIEPTITIESTEVDRAFARVASLGGNPRPALEAVGRKWQEKVMQGFATGTDPYGRPWEPLKSRPGGQPLRNKGHLMNSWNYQIEGDSMVLGTNRPFAYVHQYGATITPKPGVFWQSQHQSVGKRGPRNYTVTQPAKLVFMVGGRPVFAKQVVIPPRMMLPLDGLPQDWEDDAVFAVGQVIEDTWGDVRFPSF